MPTLAQCTTTDGKIDLAKYTGIDDSDFAHKLGFADKLHFDEWAKGGCLTAVTYIKATESERQKRRDMISDFAGIVAYNTAVRGLKAEPESGV